MFGLTRGRNKLPSEPTFSRAEVEERIRVIVANNSTDHVAMASKAIGEATRVIVARLQRMEEYMSKLEDLLSAVEAQQTKIDSLITLTDGLHKQVLDAMGDTITPSQKMRINKVFDDVTANSADIDAALLANTTPEPAPETAPEPASAPESVVEYAKADRGAGAVG